ncbi:serine protease [Bdellovibrio sp. qaytius]|nr:serine protease [Bdellovibrio sp. qaytius]
MLLSACHNAIQQQNISPKTQSKIIGGEDVPDKAGLSYSIVGIYDTEESAICTGSLIGPNLVLTAAHCINANPSKMKIIFNVDLDKVIGTKNQLFTKFFQRNVTDAKVNPAYTDPANEDKESDVGDIALIKFEGDLPEGYHPAELLSDDSILKRGFDITVAGFGVSDVHTEPINPKKVKDLQDAIDFGEVVCFDEKNTDCVSVEMSGDGILRQTHTLISSVQETEFRLDESKGHGTCSGDSGGPAYATVDGKLYLAGVTSRGSPLCNDVGVYTNVTPYIEWINLTTPLLK